MDTVFPDEATERLFQLIHMLQRTALLNLGHLPHPEGGSSSICQRPRRPST